MNEQTDVVEYMTLGETLKHDVGVICEYLVGGLALVGITLYFAVKFIGFAIYVILMILVQREITQWYLGTGEYAHRR